MFVSLRWYECPTFHFTSLSVDLPMKVKVKILVLKNLNWDLE